MKKTWKMPEIKRKQIELWVKHNLEKSKIFNHEDLTAPPTIEETVMAQFLYGPINPKKLIALITEIRIMADFQITFNSLISQGYLKETGKDKNGEPLYGLTKKGIERRMKGMESESGKY